MKKIILFGMLILIVLVAGCSATGKNVSFDDAIVQIQIWDTKYKAGMVSVPTTNESIKDLHAQLLGYRAANTFDANAQQLLEYRIKVLDAKLKYEEGWKYGKAGTTEFGFACKSMFYKVKESAVLRNESARIGNEAVILLQAFLDEYPDKAKSLNLTQRDVLALKAIYYDIGRVASRDDRVMTQFCADKINQTQETANETLENTLVV